MPGLDVSGSQLLAEVASTNIMQRPWRQALRAALLWLNRWQTVQDASCLISPSSLPPGSFLWTARLTGAVLCLSSTVCRALVELQSAGRSVALECWQAVAARHCEQHQRSCSDFWATLCGLHLLLHCIWNIDMLHAVHCNLGTQQCASKQAKLYTEGVPGNSRAVLGKTRLEKRVCEMQLAHVMEQEHL